MRSTQPTGYWPEGAGMPIPFTTPLLFHSVAIAQRWATLNDVFGNTKFHLCNSGSAVAKLPVRTMYVGVAQHIICGAAQRSEAISCDRLTGSASPTH